MSLDDSSCWDGYCNRSGGSGSNDDDDDVWNGGRDSDVVNDDHNYEHAVDACLYLYTSVVVIMGVIPRQYTNDQKQFTPAQSSSKTYLSETSNLSFTKVQFYSFKKSTAG